MKNFKKSIRYFIHGMGHGSITYLVIATFFTSNMVVSKASATTVFIFSGLTGELGLLFRTELSYSVTLVTHLVGTLILYSGMMLINHWLFDWRTILIFMIVYIIIWLTIRLVEKQHINRISQQIMNRGK